MLSCQASLKQNLSFSKNETELVSFCRALKADIFILCYHTHTSSYIASYIASLLHRHTMHHLCMNILVYIAGAGFQTGIHIPILNSQHGWISIMVVITNIE